MFESPAYRFLVPCLQMGAELSSRMIDSEHVRPFHTIHEGNDPFINVHVHTLSKLEFDNAVNEFKRPTVKEELDPMPILTQAFEMAVGQDGWAPLAGMGNALYQLDPGFDPRSYGHKQLSKMIVNLKEKFEMRTQSLDGTSILYVKMKE